MSEFVITVTKADGSDLFHVDTAPTAPAMEDKVAALRSEYPAPDFRVNVRTD